MTQYAIGVMISVPKREVHDCPYALRFINQTRIRIIHKIILICIGKDQFTKLTKQFKCIQG